MKLRFLFCFLLTFTIACTAPASPTIVAQPPTLPPTTISQQPAPATQLPPVTSSAPASQTRGIMSQPPGNQTTEPPNPSSPAPTATISAVPSLFKSGQAPVLAHGDAGTWDSKYIDPGAVLFHDGQFHMFYNGSAESSRASIGYANSPDGVNWTRAAGPLLKPENVPFGAIGIYAGSAQVEPDGTWTLYFHTVDNISTGHGSIGRATASNPQGPWQVDAAPHLTPAVGNAWDAWRVVNPSVVNTNEGYAMYYEGVDAQFGSRRIGMATSPDGRRWTRNPNPLIDASEADVWDAEGVWDPNVVQTPDGMLMLYVSARDTPTYTNGFGAAESGLGFNWTRLSDRPVLNTRHYPDWHTINNGALVWANDTLYLFAAVSTPDNETSNIWLATRQGTLDHAALSAGTYGLFSGRTPCAENIVLFTRTPADCQRIKMQLALFRDPATGLPTTYALKGTETAREGNWSVVQSSKTDQRLIRLEGDTPESGLALLQVDDILLFLDRDANPLVGNNILSYTLPRADAESIGTGVLDSKIKLNTDVLSPQAALLTPGVFEGTTPCGNGAPVGTLTPADSDCEQMLWKLTLHTDATTHAPTTYEISVAYGLPQQNTTGLINGGTRVERRGTWRVVQGTAANPQALVVQLDPDKPAESLVFEQVGDYILLLLDGTLKPMVGNAAWSYTLNRTE